MVKIVLDAMGGDNAPVATVQGAAEALKNDPQLYLILTGRQKALEEELKKYSYDKSRLEIVDCPEVIEMNDVPTVALMTKKNSSLATAFWILKKQEDVCKSPRNVLLNCFLVLFYSFCFFFNIRFFYYF